MQFLCGPLLGNLSDRYGRRPVLIISLVVMGLSNLAIAVAGQHAGDLCRAVRQRYLGGDPCNGARPIWPTFRARGNAVRISGCWGRPSVSASSLGRPWAGCWANLAPGRPSSRRVFCPWGNALLGFVAVPESLKDDNRRAFELSRANPFGALRAGLADAGDRAACCWSISSMSSPISSTPRSGPISPPCNSAGRRRWWGASLAAFGLSAALVQGWLIPQADPLAGRAQHGGDGPLDDDPVACHPWPSSSAGVWVFVFMPLTALGIVVGPAIQGMMADRVSDDQQGRTSGRSVLRRRGGG